MPLRLRVGRSLLQAENPGPNPGGATRIETVGPTPFARCRSPITNPGLDPRQMTVLANIEQFALLFQRSGCVHQHTDWTRHAHSLTRTANLSHSRTL